MAHDAQTTLLKQALKTALGFLPINADRIIDQAVRLAPFDPVGYAFTQIVASREFRRRFPGILRPDGTFRINPQEYILREQQYADIAAQFGLQMDRRRVGFLVGRDIDPEEFVERARAVQTLRQQPGLLNYIQQETGTKDFMGAVNFLLGRADRRFYERYEAGLIRFHAEKAGITIGSRLAREIAGGTPKHLSNEELAERIATVRSHLDKAGPELMAFGLSAEDLVGFAIGGRRTAEVLPKMEKAIAQREAALEHRQAQAPVGVTPAGRPVTQVRREAGF